MPDRAARLTLFAGASAVLLAATFASPPMAKSRTGAPSHSPFVKTWRCTAPVTIDGVTYLGDCYSVYTRPSR